MIIRYKTWLTSKNGINMENASLELHLNHSSNRPLAIYLDDKQLSFIKKYRPDIVINQDKEDFKEFRDPKEVLSKNQVLAAAVRNPDADGAKIFKDAMDADKLPEDA